MALWLARDLKVHCLSIHKTKPELDEEDMMASNNNKDSGIMLTSELAEFLGITEETLPRGQSVKIKSFLLELE